MKIKRFVSNHFNIIFLLLFIGLAALLTKDFFTTRNILNIVQQMTVLGLLAYGMTYVILAGFMDLSVGATMTFTGLMVVTLQQIMPDGLAILVAALIGLGIGAINGLIITLTKANSGESLMITFGTQLVLAGASLLFTGGFALNSKSTPFFDAIGIGKLFGSVPVPVLILVGFLLILGFIESRTVFGRSIHMAGFNAETSRLSGLNLNMIKVLTYAISGLMAAFAAVVLSSRTLGATPTAGEGYELDAIVAIVLGGTSLTGGSGSVFNTFIGILTLGILGNIMNLLGFVIFDQMIVKGCILIIAVFTDVWNRKQLLKA